MQPLLNVESVNQNLQDAYQVLSQLDPLSPTASPGTAQRFRQMLRSVHQHAGQLLAMATGLGTATTDRDGQSVALDNGEGEWDDLTAPLRENEDEDEDEDDDDQRPFHEKQASYIFQSMSEVPYTLQQFRDMVIGGYGGKVCEKEAEAFRRAIQGYGMTTDEQVERVFSHINYSRGTLRQRCRELTNINDINETVDRIFQRDLALVNASNDNKVNAWICSVLKTIQAIEFINEWEDRTLQFKREYRTTLARHLDPEGFARIDRQPITDKKKEEKRKALVKRFTRRHETLITARKRVRDLYIEFGPTVLLDPLWLAETSTGSSQASKTLNSVAEEVINYQKYDDNHEPRGTESYAENRQFLLTVAAELGGDAVEQYISEFLDENPVCGYAATQSQ
ncbi:hypothetical protein VKT23_009675 [Stygiomarasmius scandens]|uniref:Uncharacterized protein n=1 Tax=Marasmiellus scandens TaxID=2682957 RepID=A0ABR1JDN9_9AGAR